MNAILIRAMQLEDAAAVNLLSSQLGYPHPEAETTERMRLMLQRKNDHLLVAVEEGAVIGWIHVYKTIWLESGAFAEIAALVVDEKHRGKKVGELLVEAARGWCKAQGISRLKVRSSVLRTRAHHFYLKAGFKETKESKVFEMDIQ